MHQQKNPSTSVADWLVEAAKGEIAVLVGGDDGLLIDIAKQIAPSDLLVFGDVVITATLGSAALSVGAPLKSYLETTTLERDLSLASRSAADAAVLLSRHSLNAEIAVRQRRLRNTILVFSGYEAPSRMFARLAIEETAAMLVDALPRLPGPLAIHDSNGVLADQLPGARVFEYEDPARRATAAPLRLLEEERTPALEQVAAHARFLSETEIDFLLQAHQPILKPGAKDIFGFWRAQMLRLINTSNAMSARIAIDRLVELSERARS